MKGRLLASILLVLMLLVFTGGVWAQDGTPGESTGISSNGPVPTETPASPPMAEPRSVSSEPGEDFNLSPDGARLEDLAVQGELVSPVERTAPIVPVEPTQPVDPGDLSFPPDQAVLPEQPVISAPPPAEAAAPISVGGFVYVLRGSSTGSFIDRFAADPTTGLLTMLGSTSTGGTGGTYAVAHMLVYDPINYRLYALNDTSNTISAYSVDRASGWLTPLPFSPIDLGTGTWTSLALHPSGSPLIASNYQSYLLASYNIRPGVTNGVPSLSAQLAGTFSTGSVWTYSIAFSRDGQYLYSGGNGGTAIDGFSVDPVLGTLTLLPGAPFGTGIGSPAAYASDTSGRLFTSSINDAVSKVATTSGGVPTFVSTLSGNGLSGVVDGLYHPTGYYLAAGRGGNHLGVFRINGSGAGTTLSVVSGSPFATGGQYTQALTMNDSGDIVYALNSNSRTVTRFLFNTTSGALSSPVQAATPGATGALQGIAYAKYTPPIATGGFLYALRTTTSYDNYVDCYQSGTDGTLTLISSTSTSRKGSSMTTTHNLAYDQINARLYVLNNDSANPSVSVYTVDPTNGALALYFAPINLTVGNSWAGLAIHPSGSPLVVGGYPGLASYQITSTGANPAAGSPFSTGTANTFSMAFSQDGNYIYSGGNSNNYLAGFSVNASSGVLTALSGSPYDMGSYPTAYVTDTNGRLFLSNHSATTSRVYITNSGVPTLVSTLDPNGMTGPVHGLLHPGGFYLVADRENSKVSVFNISGSGAGTTLSGVPGSPYATGGSSTHMLALNETGDLLYASNMNSGTIARYQMNVFNGVLTYLGVTTPVSSGAKLNAIVYVPKVTTRTFVYTLVEHAATNQIAGYRLDSITGALSLLKGFPIATGGYSDSSGFISLMALDSVHQRLYVANSASRSLSAFTINPLTGALTAMPFSPYPLGGLSNLRGVAVHPSGSPVLVGTAGNQVISLNVTASSISPAASPYSLGGGGDVSSFAFSATGRYVYTGENGMYGFSVNPETGALSLIPGSPFYAPGTVLVAGIGDPTGRMFTSRFSSCEIDVATLNAEGRPVTFSSRALPGMYRCSNMALHPGGFLVIASQYDRLASLKINGSGTATTLSLNGFESMPAFGSWPNKPVFDAGYHYVLLMNTLSGSLTSYAFDAGSGGLTPVGFQPRQAVMDGVHRDGGKLTGIAAYSPPQINLPTITR